jgi:hypothetical protein
MEQMPKAGPIIGVIMALAICGGFVGIFFFNHAFIFYFFLIVPLLILVPLAIINLILTVIYVADHAPTRTYQWMWGLPVAVLLFFSIVQSFH